MDSPELLSNSTRIAPLSEERDDIYFWLDNENVLFLKLVERKGRLWERAPFVVATQFMRYFAAYTLDSKSGVEKPLTSFNYKFAKHLAATPMHMRYMNEFGGESAPREIKYVPPQSSVSSDGEWLLWRSRKCWIAARLDGSSEVRWQGQETGLGGGHWLRDSLKWIHLYQKWQGQEYVVPYLTVHRANDPSYSKKLHAEGFTDGLFAGHTSHNSILMRQIESG
jgi:hypothetical protein